MTEPYVIKIRKGITINATTNFIEPDSNYSTLINNNIEQIVQYGFNIVIDGNDMTTTEQAKILGISGAFNTTDAKNYCKKIIIQNIATSNNFEIKGDFSNIGNDNSTHYETFLEEITINNITTDNFSITGGTNYSAFQNCFYNMGNYNGTGIRIIPRDATINITNITTLGDITISGGNDFGAFHSCGYIYSSYRNSLIINMNNWSATNITISGASGGSGAFHLCGYNHSSSENSLIINMNNWSATGNITISGGDYGAFYECGFNHSSSENSLIINMNNWSATGNITISGATNYYHSLYGAFQNCGRNNSSSNNSLIMNMTDWDATENITISGGSSYGVFESCGQNNTEFSVFNCENWVAPTVTVNLNSFYNAWFTHFKFPNVLWNLDSGVIGQIDRLYYYMTTQGNANKFTTGTINNKISIDSTISNIPTQTTLDRNTITDAILQHDGTGALKIINTTTTSLTDFYNLPINNFKEIDLSECNSLTTIGKYSFYGLDQVTILSFSPVNTITFKNNSFSSILPIKTIIDIQQIQLLNSNTFKNRSFIIRFTENDFIISDNIVTGLQNTTDNNKYYLTQDTPFIIWPTISNTIIQFGDNCFNINIYTKFKNQLQKIDLSTCTQLTTIGTSAFQKCGQNSPIFENIQLPSSLTTIGDTAFEGCGSTVDNLITDITLPATLTTLGSLAFYQYGAQSTKFTKIDLSTCSNLTEIRNSTFYQCGQNSPVFENIQLPSSLTTIELSAFYQCGQNSPVFENIPFNNYSSLTTIGDYAFQQCGSSKDNLITDITLPATLTTLGAQAFKQYGAQSTKFIEIDLSTCSNLTIIEDSTFYECGSNSPVFEGISLKTTLQAIDKNAFYNVGKLSTKYQILDLYDMKALNGIGQKAFYGMQNITSIYLPEQLTTSNVEQQVFALDDGTINQTQLNLFSLNSGDIFKNRTISEIIFTEEDMAIDAQNEVTGLSDGINNRKYVVLIDDNSQFLIKLSTSAAFPIYSIGIGAFNAYNLYKKFLKQLKQIDLSTCSNLTTIKSNAFYQCGYDSEVMENVLFPSVISQIGQNAFYQCGANKQNNITNLDLSACSNLTQINDNSFFQYAQNSKVFTGIILPDSITNIGQNSFKECGLETTLITGLILPANLITIGTNAFIKYGQKSTQFQSIAFDQCVKLTTISDSAFNQCAQKSTILQNIILPASLTTLGTLAFEQYAMDSIEFIKIDLSACINLTTISNSAFNQVGVASTAFINIILPTSLTTIQYSAFNQCGMNSTVFEAVNLNDCVGLTEIQANAFNCCSEKASSVQNIDLSLLLNLTSIGENVFYNWKYVNKIYLQDLSQSNATLSLGNGSFAVAEEQQTETQINRDEFSGHPLAFTNRLMKVFDAQILGEEGDFITFTIVEKQIQENETKQQIKGLSDQGFDKLNKYQKLFIQPSTFYDFINEFDDKAFCEQQYIDDPQKYEQIQQLQNKCYKIDLSNMTSLKYIQQSVFYKVGRNVTDFSAIIIPENVLIIDAHAFEYVGQNSTKMTEIQHSNKIQSISNNAFSCVAQNSPVFKNLDFSNCANLFDIAEKAFQNCGMKSKVFEGINLQNCYRNTISGVRKIDVQAFQNCGADSTQFKYINLQNCQAITSIESEAFSGCGVATNKQTCETVIDMTGCNDLANIKDNAFYGIPSIKTIYFSRVIQHINLYADAFSVIIQETIPTEINRSDIITKTDSFVNRLLVEIDAVIIGKEGDFMLDETQKIIIGISEQGKNKFQKADKFKFIASSYYNDITTIQQNAFNGNISGNEGVITKCITIDFTNCSSLKEIQDSAFYLVGSEQEQFNGILLPSSTLQIKQKAFYNVGLMSTSESVDINLANAAGLYLIEQQAFYGVPATTISLATSSISLGKQAFAVEHTVITTLTPIGYIYNQEYAGSDSPLLNRFFIISSLNNFILDSNLYIVRLKYQIYQNYIIQISSQDYNGFNNFYTDQYLRGLHAYNKYSSTLNDEFNIINSFNDSNVLQIDIDTVTMKNISITDSFSQFTSLNIKNINTLQNIIIQNSFLGTSSDVYFNNCSSGNQFTIKESFNGLTSVIPELDMQNLISDKLLFNNSFINAKVTKLYLPEKGKYQINNSTQKMFYATTILEFVYNNTSYGTNQYLDVINYIKTSVVKIYNTQKTDFNILSNKSIQGLSSQGIVNFSLFNKIILNIPDCNNYAVTLSDQQQAKIIAINLLGQVATITGQFNSTLLNITRLVITDQVNLQINNSFNGNIQNVQCSKNIKLQVVDSFIKVSQILDFGKTDTFSLTSMSQQLQAKILRLPINSNALSINIQIADLKIYIDDNVKNGTTYPKLTTTQQQHYQTLSNATIQYNDENTYQEILNKIVQNLGNIIDLPEDCVIQPQQFEGCYQITGFQFGDFITIQKDGFKLLKAGILTEYNKNYRIFNNGFTKRLQSFKKQELTTLENNINQYEISLIKLQQENEFTVCNNEKMGFIKCLLK